MDSLSIALKTASTLDKLLQKGSVPWNQRAYKKDAVVTYNGGIYLALSDIPPLDATPDKSTKWSKLATEASIKRLEKLLSESLTSIKEQIDSPSEALSDVSMDDSTITFTRDNGETVSFDKSIFKGEKGDEGDPGKSGVGIQKINNEDDRLYITYTNGITDIFRLPLPDKLQAITFSEEESSFQFQYQSETIKVPVDLPVGNDGKSASITIGEVAEGDIAAVENAGNEQDVVLNITLPKANDGVGVASIEQVNDTLVAITLTDNRLFTFVLPKAEKGEDANEQKVIDSVYGQLLKDTHLKEYKKELENDQYRIELESFLEQTI
jgi:hypothetical protein